MKTPTPLIAAVLLTLTATASAGEADGQPKIAEGKQTIAYGWQDAGGLHFRVTTPVRKGNPHHVIGSACAASKDTIGGLKATMLESGDSAKLGPHGHCVFFDFKTNGHIDGFDFNTASKTLTLTVKVDGKLLSPSQIHLGAKGQHPKRNPAVIRR